MGSFFYNLGRLVGPKLRKADWVYRSLLGTEAEAAQAEYAVGRDLAQSLLGQVELDPDPAARSLVQEIGGCLADRLKQRRPFHLYPLLAPEVNAFALPGGFVFVTRPLLRLCQGERDELAFVLGHEMGHVVKRHAIDRLMADAALRTALSRWNPAGGWLRGPLTQVAASLVQQGYSQDQELEADEFAVRLARASGFDPAGGARLLGRLREFAPGVSLLNAYFSSHPPLEVRLRRVSRA